MARRAAAMAGSTLSPDGDPGAEDDGDDDTERGAPDRERVKSGSVLPTRSAGFSGEGWGRGGVAVPVVTIGDGARAPPARVAPSPRTDSRTPAAGDGGIATSSSSTTSASNRTSPGRRGASRPVLSAPSEGGPSRSSAADARASVESVDSADDEEAEDADETDAEGTADDRIPTRNEDGEEAVGAGLDGAAGTTARGTRGPAARSRAR